MCTQESSDSNDFKEAVDIFWSDEFEEDEIFKLDFYTQPLHQEVT